MSKVTQETVADGYNSRRRERLRAEVRQDLAAWDWYAKQRGGCADLVREHYELFLGV